MSSGDNMTRDEGIAVVPKWNEEADTLDSFEKRVGEVVRDKHTERGSFCGPRALA